MNNKVYTDYYDKNPVTAPVLRGLIMGDDFATAWWAVSVYILRMSLEPFHYRLMNHQLTYKRSLVMAGRGFGKSYLLNTAFTLTIMLRDPHVRIATVTRSLDLSREFIKEMRNYFEEGQVIYEVFGDLKGDPWGAEEFSLKRDRIIKEPTVKAGSMNSSGAFVGSHFDIIIMDDIVGEENSLTKLQRDKLETYVFTSVIPTLHKLSEYQRVHCIGTHYHPMDFWTILESRRYNTLKVRSLYQEDGEYKSVCPFMATADYLLKEREEFGSRIFSMQYQQEIPKARGNIFRDEWVQHFSKYQIRDGSVYIEYETKHEEVVNEKVRVYMGVDLASSQKTTADYFVISVIGIGVDTNNIFALDMVRDRLTFNEQMNSIKKMANKWNMVERIGIESVAYQESLPDELMRTTNLPIIKVQAIKDKVTRMNRFSARWENYKVYLYSHMDKLMVLVDETLSFPSAEHDDTIDSLEIAVQTAESNAVQRFNRDVIDALGF